MYCFRNFAAVIILGVVCLKMQVSIIALTPCRYVRWNRQLLETLFSKEQFLMTVMQHIIGRDITNKLYQFTDKVPVLFF